MNKLLQELASYQQKSADLFQNKAKQAYQQIVQQNEMYEKFIENADANAAMIDLVKLSKFETPTNTTIPKYLRFGYLIPETKGGKPLDKVHIPLLLPMSETAVVLFDMENLKTDEVAALFQTFALRYLLTMKMRVCRFYMIDANFGTGFREWSTVNNKQLQKKNPVKTDDIIDELQNVRQTNQHVLKTHKNLTEYNEQAGLMAQPYHFVFINDFPNVFSKQALDGFYDLIRNGNALAGAGIHIFINYNNKMLSGGFDINRFKSVCACVNSNAQGDVTLTNWNIRIPLPKYKIVIETALPKNVKDTIDFINNIEEEDENITLDAWIDDLKKNKQIWKDATINGIRVPVGYISSSELFHFYLANDNDSRCKDFFALVAGLPGLGKTVLLHNVIVNACMKYPPDELQLYLADFAAGASFGIYRDLPHAKALMLTNNKDYALRMIKHLVAEFERRTQLYQDAQNKCGQEVTTLATYRKITGEKLPRIILLMDEFHYLFNSPDLVTMEAKKELCNGIKQWRKVGISVVLCTQSISGVNFGDAEKFITYRFALSLSKMDSISVIRNSAATALTRKGQIIMNNSTNGDEKMNVEFQCAFTTRYMEHVNWLAQVYRKNFGELPIRYICEAGTDADIADSITIDGKKLLRLLEDNNFTVNNQYCDVYVGKPDILRDSHTRIQYRRQPTSNTLYVGEDFRTMSNSIAFSLIQLQKQSAENSKCYIIDCFNAGDEFLGTLDGLNVYSPTHFETVNSQSVADCIKGIADNELEKRKQAQTQGQVIEERIVIVVLSTQNCYDLKPQQSGPIPTPSVTSKKMEKILDEGAPLGIHCIIHSLFWTSLFGQGKIFPDKVANFFENKIILKGADMDKVFLGGIKPGTVENNGMMTIVRNNKLDGEIIEQCKSYSKITTNSKNPSIDFLGQLFNKKRNA